MLLKRARGLIMATCVAVGVLAIDAAVMASEVVTSNATRYGLKAPVFGSSDGTKLDWGDSEGWPRSIYISMWNQMMLHSTKFSFWGHAGSSEYNFSIDNADTSVNGTLLRLSTASTPRLTVFGDGRLAVGTSTYASGEKLHVMGKGRITQGLVAEQGLTLGSTTTPSAQPVVRPYATTNPSTAGVVDGDLAFDSDADPATGALAGGSGAWVVFDSTVNDWKVLKQF